MALTEPDAGSDVGAGRTKAIAQPDGTWHIEGVKRFITSAEHDMAENIFHLVLARPEGAGPGHQGPVHVPGAQVPGRRRTASWASATASTSTNVEHKMGLKASTTCELTFGGDRPAVGTLVGDVHDGIRQMFVIIEFARMMVGTKAIATLSAGYLTALDFARNRVQGADLTQLADKTAPRVTIIHHPDVRRLLMLQKAYAEGMRALVLYTATFQDALQVAGRAGPGRRPAPPPLNDLLLPVVKGVGSERAYEMLTHVAADPRRLRLPAGLPDRAVRQGRQDRQPLRGHDRDPGHGPVLPQDRPERGPGARLPARADQGLRRRRRRQRPAQGRARRAGPGGRRRRGHGDRAARLPRRQRRSSPPRSTGSGLNTTRLLLALGDLLIGWLLARQAEIALARLRRGDGRRRAAATGRSTRGRSPPRGSSPRRCCPGWPPSARSPRRPRWT